MCARQHPIDAGPQGGMPLLGVAFQTFSSFSKAKRTLASLNRHRTNHQDALL